MKYDEVEEEFEILKDKLANGKMGDNNNFIREDDYEDEYSLDEIHRIQQSFIDLAESYLDKHYKGQYVIYRDWCVHICTVDFYNIIGNKQ